MSLFNSNTFLEEIGIKPIRTDYISPVTGEVVKKCAPTSLKDSYAIVTANLQKYYDSKPKSDTIYDEDDELDYVSPITKNQRELTYTTTEEECKLKTESLLQYLEMMSKNYSPKTLFIERENTSITFGEIARNGEKIVYGSMGMSNDNILRTIYELIRVRFADSFKEQITIGYYGWSLSPFISDETDLEISSNRVSDIEWIQQEKDIIQEKRKQGKGLPI